MKEKKTNFNNKLDSKPDGETGGEAPPASDQEPKADSSDPPAATTAPDGKRNLLGSIKLPTLGSLIPKRLRKGAADDIELGNGPNNRAGLASMETLDDSLKDTEKDTVDKNNAVNNATDEDKMETIKLTTEEKDAEKAAEAEQDKVKQATFLDRIRAYRCSIGEFLKS